jgi:O-antigen/teichoic acid export membrane protein
MALEPEAVEPDVEDEVGTGRRILVNAGYRTIADVGSKIISIALYVVMARRLGDSGFGVFTFGLSFVTLVTTLGDFGQDRILTREVARDRRALTDYLGNTLALKLSLAIPALVLATGLLVITGAERETQLVVVLLGVAVIAELLMSTEFSVFQAFERMAPLPVVLISQRLVTALIGIIALLQGAGVVAVAAIYLLGALFALLLSTWFLVRLERPELTVDRGRWWPLMRAAIPVGLASVFATVLFRVDTAMLAAYESDSVVGNYGAAYRLLETTLFLSWSIGAAVYPVFSRLSRNSRPPIANLYERSLQLVVALTLPLAVGAAVLARPLIELLYTSEFSEAADALVLLSPAIALFPVCYVTGYLLVSQDRQIVSTYTYGIVAIVNIVLNLILIPAFSLRGAAINSSISYVIVLVVVLTFARQTAGPVDWKRILLSSGLGSAAAGAAMWLLDDTFALAVAAGVAAYVSVFLLVERIAFGTTLRSLVGLVRDPANAAD